LRLPTGPAELQGPDDRRRGPEGSPQSPRECPFLVGTAAQTA
jgi:hypothetical protein